MKKFLIYLCVICVTFTAFIFIFSNTNIINNISGSVDLIAAKFSSKNLQEYNSDFIVNDLGAIKYNTYYYDNLTVQQQQIYTSVANSVKNLDTTSVVKIDEGYNFNNIADDIKVSMESFFADHPEVFYLNTEYQILTNSSIFGNSVKIYLGYSVESLDNLNAKILEIKNGIDDITSEISSDDTVYQKELKIHDKIARTVQYYNYESIPQIPEMYHTAYSGISEKSAVCDGFTKLFQLALNKESINSVLVTGMLDGDPHAWNMVELDGQWYNVDLTSNKTIKENNNAVIHTYFNVNNEYIKGSHSFSDESTVPNAISEEYNYYVQEDKIITSSENFNRKFENILKNNKDNNLVEFLVDEKVSSVPEKVVKRLSQRDYTEYVDLNKNTIQYYNILRTYVIMKK